MSIKTQKDGYLKTTSKDLFSIDSRELTIIEEFNARVDYGDMDSLVESIRENGVKEPLKGYRKDGTWFVVNGHRRLRACGILNEEGVFLKVPFVNDSDTKDVENATFSMLLCNDGLRLNPLEEADVIGRLLGYKLNETEIAKKTGKSLVYISNLKRLQDSPARLKNLITEGVISGTQALKILRETEDFESAIKVVENAMNYVKEKRLEAEESNYKQRLKDEQDAEKDIDKEAEKDERITQDVDMGDDSSVKELAVRKEDPIKVTQKDIDASNDRWNSFSLLKKTIKKKNKENIIIKLDAIPQWDFVNKLVNGELNLVHFEDMFFNNDIDEELEEGSEIKVETEENAEPTLFDAETEFKTDENTEEEKTEEKTEEMENTEEEKVEEVKECPPPPENKSEEGSN